MTTNKIAEKFQSDTVSKSCEMLELLRYVAQALLLRDGDDDERTMRNLRQYVYSQLGIKLKLSERYPGVEKPKEAALH